MKKYVIIAFLMFLVALSSCSKEEDDGTLKGSFYGGVEGVSIEFKKSSPTDQFDQGEEIPAIVTLKNSGEYDIVSGKAKAEIYGINLETFNIPEGYKGTNGILRGKGEFNLEGGEREIDFGNLRYDGEIINSGDFIIRARVCYPYQTKTDVPVCIKSATSQEAGESVCNIEGEKVVDNTISSAPIQVTSITEKTRGSGQVRFDVKVENKGTGNVYSNDMVCEDLSDYQIEARNKDKMLFEVINPTNVVCSFRSGEESDRGVIELDNNEEIISCWMEADGTYVDNLRITLSYMYTDTTSKDITIFEK
ncbi:hypothetical protein J4446_00390 [Candidatus Woesearchaeota archaeon]|nr:hypothetical protein [Candidatus Woesearchaeota archaeon]